MKIAHLTTVDLSLRYLVLPQLEAARGLGEAIGISAPGRFVAELEARGIRHVSLPSSTRGASVVNDLRAMAQLWSVLRTERLDVLHTHNPKPGVYGRVLGRLAGVPIVVNTVHGLYATDDSPPLKRLVVYALEAIASRFSDTELIQNPEDLELLHRRRIVAGEKLRLLGNGVDLERFNPERASNARAVTRSELGLEPGDVAVGMVGRLVAEKGVPELIEAVRSLDDPIRVFVVGPHDPAKSDALGPQVFAGQDRISYLGMRTDVEDLYGAFDVFVLPSHREGFPRAAMEAAASGLPLVLTDIRGCRQVVEDGVNGLLVPVRDPSALAHAIRELAADGDLRRRMGVASVEKARRDFDERRVVEIVMDTYRHVAERKGLAWQFSVSPHWKIRPAAASDARAIAQLHTRMIGTGFLSSLGPGFLTILYSALIDSPVGKVIVAESDGIAVGFIAGTADTGAFYREFLRRRWWPALWRVLPALARWSTWRRLLETLRYAGDSGEGSSELLSMVVAPRARESGLGSRLVASLLDWAEGAGIREMRVVVGADNDAAISLYTKAGFADPSMFELHSGVRSLVMTWRC